MSVVFDQAWDYGRPQDFDPKITLNNMPLYGIERAMGVDDELPDTGTLRAFLCFDDDGNLTHSGRLRDDDECTNQSAALRWAESDAGATRILVLDTNGLGWKQDIG